MRSKAIFGLIMAAGASAPSAARRPRPSRTSRSTPDCCSRRATATPPGVERALKAGAAVNSRNRLGETALIIALKQNDLAMARKMLDAGTDVNLAAVNGVTPLMAAALRRPHGDRRRRCSPRAPTSPRSTGSRRTR